MSASAAAVALIGSSRRARAIAVWFSLDQHGPDYARSFGGEGHRGDLVGPPTEQFAQPWIADTAALLLSQMGAGPLISSTRSVRSPCFAIGRLAS